MNRNAISHVVSAVFMLGIVMLFLHPLITVSVPAAENEVYFNPQDSSARFCEDVKVEIWVNATEFQGGQINLTYNPTCANVTNWVRNTTNFLIGGWLHYDGREWITFSTMDPQPPLLTGRYMVGMLTIHCVKDSKEGCETPLAFIEPSTLFNDTGIPVQATWTAGTFECVRTPTIFDTGSSTNPYPSISGTHNGTITPSQDITVQKLYTYPCSGTGGHTEHVRIWNDTWAGKEAYWKGYQHDWHNITFDEPFTLFAEKTYKYEIRTGSYPQIIHKPEHTTLDGSFINCTSFVDANGKEYTNWIPAIRLWP